MTLSSKWAYHGGNKKHVVWVLKNQAISSLEYAIHTVLSSYLSSGGINGKRYDYALRASIFCYEKTNIGKLADPPKYYEPCEKRKHYFQCMVKSFHILL
jgi:hypothetical protein